MKRLKYAVFYGCLLMGMASTPLPVFAHGGEDHSHGDETPIPVIIPASNGIRWELRSPDVELLGIISAGKLTLYVDVFSTSDPIPNAKVELESAGQKLTLQTDVNGIAQVDAGWLAKPGRHEITVSVLAKGVNDLLIGAVLIPSNSKEEDDKSLSPWWKFWGNLLQDTFLPKVAFAHGGEDHSHAEDGIPSAVPLPAAQDKPTRLADGSLFIPKPAQRVLGIRTAGSKPQAVAQSVTLNGVVITDPNASALIQPTINGHLLAPDGGFPSIGSSVKKGQILAILEPAANNIDKGDQQEKIAAARSELALAEKNATRLQRIAGVIPQMEVDAARNTADTLKARLKALQGSLAQQPQPLTAPLSGIVSTARVMLGQQANAGDVLFEIIDPARLQVEALAYDAALAGQITNATAILNGQTLTLAFVGSSQQLRNQALPLRFSLLGSASLSVGQPLKLAVQTSTNIQGTPLPASSVVNNNQQQPTVWVKTAAERFTPHVVKLQTLDADTVVITEGLPNSSIRAVTTSAALLSQVR
ncbi:HlyD family efflux transporter periplasmic adaptor subunit [Thiothrix sp.]|jgi:multidrug efflux pump subunit AcrA (membrane-fusion protein)|uniref:efflux RND transporter periplasmic adaptor subunit n=1 Tax=Thiothrix sp. TaxID=1032 RepID=UPI00257C441B|nr:HlyD family efflux transporter periplasmic adaptor subunit [Thiothrix sp.]